MTNANPTSAAEAEGRFRPSMNSFGALLITLSCLSPSIGVFVVGSDVIRQAGTGVFVCFAAAALLGVGMACVYGELGSAFPVTGAEYTMFGRVLGPAWGVAILTVQLLGFSVAQSMSGLGVATYLGAVAPGLPPVPTALVLVVVVTGLGVLNIRVNALVTGAFLAVELAALVFVGAIGLLHPHRALLAAAAHPVVAGPGGVLHPASLLLVGAAASGGIYAFNGYGSVVLLGEELHQAASRIVRVVFLALGLAAVTELVPVASILMGAPDLKAVLASPAPISAFVSLTAGPTASKVLSLAVALAIFNAMIAVALMGGRQLYASGRDHLWPTRFSLALTRLHPRYGSPYVATFVLGAVALLACFVDQRILILVLGNGNVALYVGLCLAVIFGRANGTTAHAAFKTPWHPLVPGLSLLVLVGVVWFDLQDRAGLEGLLATLLAMAAGFVYYMLALRRRPAFSYRVPGLDGDAREELQPVS